MKYNKKVSFLQKGNRMGTTAGKSNAEIMAEARRNAAPARKDRERAEREQRAYDNIPEAQKEAIRRVHAGNAAAEREAKIQGVRAGFQRPTARVEMPTQNTQTRDQSHVQNLVSIGMSYLPGGMNYNRPPQRTTGIPFRNRNRTVAAPNVSIPRGG